MVLIINGLNEPRESEFRGLTYTLSISHTLGFCFISGLTYTLV